MRAQGEGLTSAEVNNRASFSVNIGRSGGHNDVTATITCKYRRLTVTS